MRFHQSGELRRFLRERFQHVTHAPELLPEDETQRDGAARVDEPRELNGAHGTPAQYDSATPHAATTPLHTVDRETGGELAQPPRR